MISLASSAARSPLTTTAELFDFLGSRGQPALCQYQDQERIEISGRVLVNWATKVANLLDMHFPTPPTRFVLVGPAHWKFFSIVLGARLVGIEPQWLSLSLESVREEDFDDAVLVTDASADQLSELSHMPAELIQVDLATLATEYGDELDPFALDFAVEVPAQPDQLLARIVSTPLPPNRSGNTIIAEQAEAEVVPPAELVEVALGTWAGGSSLVISDAENLETALRQEAPRFSVRPR